MNKQQGNLFIAAARILRMSSLSAHNSHSNVPARSPTHRPPGTVGTI